MSLNSLSEASHFTDEFSTSGKTKNEPLSDCVKDALDNYFNHLDGYTTNDLYRMVLEEVEKPLFEYVLTHTGGNQTQAASLMGLSRSTLRKKMAYYGIA